MIPLADIVPKNLYSQADAPFLLGAGFTPRAAKEAISQACRTGDLPAMKWRRKYWFSGAVFLDWVARWFGEEGLRAVAFHSGEAQDVMRRTGSALGRGSP